MKKRKLKKPTVSKLKKEADRVFSIWIRKRDRNVCFTCGGFAAQNGHYVSRSFNSLRYDERNCNAQCVACNVFRYGNMPEYSVRLVRKYGEGILEELVAAKRTIKQFAARDLEAIIKKYTLN